MKKVIEVDFLPRNSDLEFFHPGSIAGAAVEEKRRILIVDSDRDSTHLVKMLLERTGRYSVLEENDATRAHQSARNFRPDLILLDPAKAGPEIDGGEIAAQIQADPQLQRTPIIFLTPLSTKDEAKTDVHIQGYPFLAKPLRVPELINWIEEQLPGLAGSLAMRSDRPLLPS